MIFFVGQAVDMWALGCILHILLCGKMPFKNLNSAVQDRKVLEGAWDTEGKVRPAGLLALLVAAEAAHLGPCAGETG